MKEFFAMIISGLSLFFGFFMFKKMEDKDEKIKDLNNKLENEKVENKKLKIENENKEIEKQELKEEIKVKDFEGKIKSPKSEEEIKEQIKKDIQNQKNVYKIEL